MGRARHSKYRGRGRVIMWSVCVVVGAALMAIVLAARLSHDAWYGSVVPPWWQTPERGSVWIVLADGRRCEVPYMGAMEVRTLLGSDVARYRWQFLKRNEWVLESPAGLPTAIYSDFQDALRLLDEPGAQVTGVAEFVSKQRSSEPGSGTRLPSAWMWQEGRPGVTNELARRALMRARARLEQERNPWQQVNYQVRPTRPGLITVSSDALPVTTELDHPSVWVYLGQFVTVHPWVFGMGSGLVVGTSVEVVRHGVRHRRWRKQGRCLRCGYEMREVVEAMRKRGEEKIVCPECGEVSEM